MVAPYQTTLAGFESTGGRRMYNALGSGATGKYQFMPETWADLMRRFPNAGLTPAGITDNSEGGQQDIALQLFNASNNRVLKQSLGRDPLAWETYTAHRFGAGGAQDLFGASDDTPVRMLFPPKWIEQNPDIADKTAGEVKTLFQGRFGQSPPVEVSARKPAQPVQETPAMAAPQMPATPPVPGLLYDPASAAPAQDAGKDTSGWGGLLGEGGWQSALVAGLMSLGDGLRGGSGGAGLQMLMAAQQAQQQRKDRAEDRKYKDATLQIQLMNALKKSNGAHVVGKHLVDDSGKVLFESKGGDGGPFQGTSMDAQASNMLLTLGPKVKDGSASPQERAVYEQAYLHLSQPRVVGDPVSGYSQVKPQMPTWAPPPGGAPAQSSPSPASAPPAPAAGPTVTPIQTGTGQSATDRTKLKAAEVETGALKSALGEFRSALDETGFLDNAAAVTGIRTAGASKLNTRYNNAALMAKSEALFNLGVLNGPDLDIIRRTLTDPSTVASLGTSKEAWKQQIADIEKLVDARLSGYRHQFGGQGGPAVPAAPAAGPRVLRFDAQGNPIP